MSQLHTTMVISEYCFAILLVLIAGVGIFCNFIFLVIIRGNRNRAGDLVFTLLIADLCFLTSATFVFGLPVIAREFHDIFLQKTLPSMYGIAHVSRVASAYIIVSITLDHYLALKCQSWGGRLGGYLIPASLLLSVIFNIPRFFEFKIPPPKLNDLNGTVSSLNDVQNSSANSNNLSKSETAELRYEETHATDLRNNPIYALLYVLGGRLLFTELVPYILLIFMIISIQRKIRSLSLSSELENDDERRLRKILITRAGIFIVCQSMKLIPDMYEMIACEDFKIGNCPQIGEHIINVIIDLSHLLLVVNSCANPILYILYGSQFHDSLIKLLSPPPPRVIARRRSKRGQTYEMVSMAKMEDRSECRYTNNSGKPPSPETAQSILISPQTE